MTKSNIKKLFGNKIKTIRKSLNMSQEEFGYLIGLEQDSISKIENGRRFPSPKIIDEISYKLQLDYAQLFDFKNNEKTLNIDKKIQLEVESLNSNTKEFFYNFIKIYKLKHKQ
ncbi:MAG: helix-turn-helix transcriptional regulator [Candidatus Gastranaerophilales bacterium]|nr:helix-turn-helix transcriptional regulator [Candidatus Gastranaerophilales bacterium]